MKSISEPIYGVNAHALKLENFDLIKQNNALKKTLDKLNGIDRIKGTRAASTLEVQDFVNDMTAWSVKTFGNVEAVAPLHHLKDEVIETIEAIESGDTIGNIKMEFADCFILLTQAAQKFGLTFDQLFQAAKDKMIINKARTWGTPDKNGVVKHINND